MCGLHRCEPIWIYNGALLFQSLLNWGRGNGDDIKNILLNNAYTVEPRFNEPLLNEVPAITNDILCPVQSYSKMYGIEPLYNEPRFNEFFDITNIIRKPKRKIYLDITNYNVNTRQEINTEQINTLKVSFFCKQKLRVCSKVKIIATESHHA